jgi:phenylalanyl-tRNA synthetase beta chain
MKISYNWLKDYLALTNSPDEISTILTDIGLEVEGVHQFQSVKGGLKDLVVGKVLTSEKHPNADKLSVTTVDIGQGEPLHIVCGAPNVAAGQKVVVAPVGTTLHSIKGEFEIKKAKIRGEISEGMICAEDEIGIGDSHEGIIELDPATEIGKPVSEHFEVIEDIIFEIGLTPNRIDGASHIGTARDLAAFLNQRKEISYQKPSVDAFKADSNDYPVEIVIEDLEACPRYAGVTVADIKIKPSPMWLQNRLKAIGLNPINNIVDITNFVLHETGQPLHAFDADKLKGRKIVVKKLPDGTKFKTLDEEERNLSSEDLMICDAEGPVAIGGVFGGIDSGVTAQTKNVFIESAYFSPVSVRRTAKRHGLSTDASFRFERGVDPNNTIYAMKRAALLMKELGEGTIASQVTDVYPVRIDNFIVDVTYRNIDRLIGKRIEREVIKKILVSLEIKILVESADQLKLEVPAYRVDVQREADVIEEILRIYGYNNVEISGHIKSSISFQAKPNKEKYVHLISDFLSSNGFIEIMSNSLTRQSYYEGFKEYSPNRTVEILNPLSQELNGLRQSLLFGGLEAIIYNANRRHADLFLYEFGNCYQQTDQFQKKEPLSKYVEDEYLGMWLTGKKQPLTWSNAEEEVSFFTIKAYVEATLKRLGIYHEIDKIEESDSELFAYGLTYYAGNTAIAQTGEVLKEIVEKYGIEQDVYYADLKWHEAMSLVSQQDIQFTELPKFPEVKRDFALLIDTSTKFEQIRQIAFRTEKKLLQDVQLFDVYKGNNIEEGKKSYGVSFILQDISKTLTDKQIDKTMDRLQKAFEKELNAKIR